MGLFAQLFGEPRSSANPHQRHQVKPLHAAAYAGDLQGVLEILISGADVNEGIEMGNRMNATLQNVTALFLAAQRNHTQVIKALLQHGANPGVHVHCGSSSKKESCTPAQIAALNGHPITAMFLRKTAKQVKQKRSSTISLASSRPANSTVFGRGTCASSAASSAVDFMKSQHVSPAPSWALAPSLVQVASPRSSAKELSVGASDPQVDSQPTSTREEAVHISGPQTDSQATSPAMSRVLECAKQELQDMGLQDTHQVDTPFAGIETQEGLGEQQEQPLQQEHDQKGPQQHEQNGQVQQLPTQPQHHRTLTLAQQQKVQRHRQRVQQERKLQEEKEEQERRKQERLQQQQQFKEEQVRKRELKKHREEQLRKQEHEQQLLPTLQPAVSRMSSLSSNESLFGGTKGPKPTQQPNHEGNTEDGIFPEGLSSNGANRDAAQAEAGAQVYLPLPPNTGIKAVQ